MWDGVEVQWFVSNGITLKFPCQASLPSPQTVNAKNHQVLTPLFAACVVFMGAVSVCISAQQPAGRTERE